jgi:biopolymer transport protein ExbD
MITLNFRRVVYVLAGAISLGVLLLLLLTLHNRSRVSTDRSELIHILLPAREHRPMLILDEDSFISDDFMIIQQPVAQPPITEPISDQLPDTQLIEQDSGTLTVTIAADRSVTLNTESLGTLNDTAPLTSKLSALFRERVSHRTYLAGFETRTDLPAMQRIPRTVLVRPSGSLTYGDVMQIIDLLKELRADPIALQINHLPT